MSSAISFINTTDPEYIMNFTENSTMDNLSTTLAPLATAKTHPIVALVVYTYLGPIICAMGMLFNIINFAVLMQHQLKESPYTYLTGLAMVDFSALTLSFIYMVISHKAPGVQFWRYFDAYIFLPFVNVCTTSSVWIIVLLTIERFLFVMHPLWAKAKCDRASAKVKNLIIVAVALVTNIPRFLVFQVVEDPPGFWKLKHTAFRKSDFFLGTNWFYSGSVQITPLFILLFANTYLVFAVMRARKQREQLQIRNNKEATWHRDQIRLTITLISIVCLFIICILPSAFSDFPIAFFFFGGEKDENQFRTSEFYLILQYVANFLVWCNLSLNFVLYCAFNEKFRRVMRHMIKRWLKLGCIKQSYRPFKVSFNINGITRNNSSQTNSLTQQTKCSMSMGPHEILKLEKVDNSVSQTTALFDKSDADN
ncbi:FMRFamide receptor-like [Ostrea edulis]|uniref:FMRFamide receptor-like n=1 Tax=Ostrea edulis TaxID=37623 RepID=UPI002096291A|nr:FMRFamide receptor-like [Ostrea edulis]